MNGNTSRKALKTSFRASPRSLRPIYTGGPVLLTQDGRWLISTMGEEVMITEVATGVLVAKIRGDGSPITSLCLSEHTAPATLITSHFSQVVRYYPLPQSFDGEKAVTLTYTRQLVRAHSAPILVSASAPDSTLFATGSSDGIVKVWDSAGGYATHLFRGHGGPVSALRFNFPSVAEGEAPRMELITGSTDGRVRIFDLRDASSRVVGGGGAAAKAKYTLDGHVSVVRAIDITADGKCMITGGRDKVVLVWDMEGNIAKGKGKGKNDGPKIVQTIIAGEQVETAGLLPVDEDVLGSQDGRLKCWTGGEKGVVKIWDVQSAKQLGQMKGVEGVDEDEDKDEDEQRGIISILSDATRSSLVSVHADQNILFHSIATSSCVRQIIGFNDEIVDTTFLTHPSSSGTSDLASHSHLAMATNSNMIRIYSLSTFSASLLSGHKDMVLCLDKSADFGMLASGAKDSIARIWAPVPSSDASEAGQEKWVCVGICEGHAESVGAIAFSRKPDPAGPRFLVTASQDRTIKLWDLSPLADLSATSDTVPIKLKSLATIRAHEKDINSLDVAPNDKFIASGSQDKLVKLFALDYTEGRANEGARGGLKLLGTCKGHRRGVWTVRFSRTDRVVASGAADRSVRLWSLDDFSCLKTFEGHTNAVLRVDFLSSGMQLVTSASDGLVKLWNIRDEACVRTLDNHEDKIWSISVASDEATIISAGADSLATFWQDSSAVEQKEKNDAIVAAVQSEQDFVNYLALRDYSRAIKLALSMNQPGRLLSLFSSLRASLSSADPSDPVSYTGSPEVDRVISTLPDLDLVRLLKMVRDWNANARTSPVAQGILHCILRLRSAEQIVQAFERVQGVKNAFAVDGEDGENAKEAGAEDAGEGDEAARKRPRKQEVLPALNELLEGLIPYAQRHFTRIDKLVQDSYALDYLVGEMDGGVFGAELLEV